MNYKIEKYKEHYIIIDEHGRIIEHCDNLKECYKEIEQLKQV